MALITPTRAVPDAEVVAVACRERGRAKAFARKHGVDFYPPGTGISHQVMVEQGYVVPGSLVVASDSHSNLYGAMSALGTT